MKLKNKILRWGLLSLALISALSALTSIYTVSHPRSASAADAYAPIGLQADSKKACAAYIHAPGYIPTAYQTIDKSAAGGLNFNDKQYGGPWLTDAFRNLSGLPLSAEAKRTLALTDAAYITFQGNNSRYDSACSEDMFLVQSADDHTKFYGLWFNPVGGSIYQEQAATVDPKSGTLQFNLVYSNFNKSFTIQLNDMNTLPPGLFPTGGGTGGVSDGSCVTTVGDDAGLKNCIDNAGTFFMFKNAATITFGKDTYTATNWGNSGSDNYKNTHIEYMLSNSGYTGRVSSGSTPEIDLDTKVYDINIDDLNGSDIDKFFTNLSKAAVGGHVQMDFKNFNQSGQATEYKNVSVNSANIDIFAGYYPSTKSVVTYFTGGGDNEKHFIMTYAQSPTSDFVLSDGVAIDGCTAAKPSITLQVSDFSKLQAGSMVAGVWHMQDSTCSPHNGTIRTLIQGANDTPPQPQGAAQQKHDLNPTCDTDGDPLTWILCPVFNSLADLADWMMQNVMVPMLRTAPISTNPSDPLFKVWSNFRIYGNIILVFALLFNIYAEIIGGGQGRLKQTYGAKVGIPSVCAAALFVNLSAYGVAGIYDLANIAGNSLGTIMTQPIANAGAYHFTPGGISSMLVVGGAATAGTAVALLGYVKGAVFAKAAMPILLFVIMPLILGLITAFAAVVIRKGLMIGSFIVSPIPAGLYGFAPFRPYARKFFMWVIKLAGAYPIYIFIFVIGDIVTYVVVRADPNNPLSYLVAVVIQGLLLMLFVVVPYALDEATKKIYDVVTSTHKRAQEGIKGNPNDPMSARNRAKRGLGEALTAGQMRVVQAGRKDANGNLVTGWRAARSRFAGAFGSVDSKFAAYNEQAQRRRDQLTNFGDDTVVFAGAGYMLRPGEANYDGTINNSGQTKYYNGKGQEINRTTYQQGKARFGSSQHEITQSMGYTIYKANTDDQVSAFQFAFEKNAEAGGWTQQQAQGNWLGATYPYKGQFASVRYSEPVRNADGSFSHKDLGTNDKAYYEMLKDLHRTRQAFRLNEMRDKDWQVLQQRQHQLEAKVVNGTASDEEAQALAMTYEVFDGASQELMRSRAAEAGEGGDTVSAAGATPAAQQIIENSVHGRALRLTTHDLHTNEMRFDQIIPPPAGSAPGTPSTARQVRRGIFTTGDSVK